MQYNYINNLKHFRAGKIIGKKEFQKSLSASGYGTRSI